MIRALKSRFRAHPSPAVRNHFWFWMLAGLFLRLLIMPFFCHADFLSEYRRVYMTIENGLYFPQLTRLVVYLVELLTLAFSLPLLPNAREAFFFSDLSNSTAVLPEYFGFVSNPAIFRTLFLLKLPYLFFDLATAALIHRASADSGKQMTALKLWLFNPVTVYAFYIFGRFESIPIFFLVLGLTSVQRRRYFLASLALGLALNCREIIVIFIPVFLLALLDAPVLWSKIARRAIPSAAIIGALFILPKAVSRLFHITPLFYDKTVLETDRALHLLDYRMHWLLPFVFTYFLICLWLVDEKRRDPFDRVLIASGTAMAAFFMFTGHSAHYVSWLIAFPLLMMAFDRDVINAFWLLCGAWLLMWMFATDTGVFTLLLASPLSITFSNLRTLPQWYDQWSGSRTIFNLGLVILILNNAYHASMAFLCYKFFSKRRT